MIRFSIIAFFLTLSFSVNGQDSLVLDDFEGNGTIESWMTQDVVLNTSFQNPYPGGINSSDRVLEYRDLGGQYANLYFDVNNFYNLRENYVFSINIYVPSSSVSGSSPNQVSLKLQSKYYWAAWANQTEIVKPIVLDQWQTITFDFLNDPYINIDPGSAAPTERFDFNRVLLQINGENNNDAVTAYIDDFSYNGALPEIEEYNDLVWIDEFDVNGAVDPSKWHHQTQTPNPWGWHNGEIQHYTDRAENSSVQNDILSITALRESFNDQGLTTEFTSARLNAKHSFQYGKVVIRAKMPAGVGTWPALWMLGKNINEDGAYWDDQGFGTTGWPSCGEIDIIEHWGSNQNVLQSATHTPSSSGNTFNKGGRSANASEFHDYELIWSDEQLVFSIDGLVHYIYNPEVKNPNTWPFDEEQYIIMNLAVLPEIETQISEAALEVDYVRVYQNVVDTNTMDTSIVDTMTSVIDRLLENSIHIYPNPSTHLITIDYGSIAENDKTILALQITNILGQQYLQKDLVPYTNFVELNIQDYPKGIYLVNLYSNGVLVGRKKLLVN